MIYTGLHQTPDQVVEAAIQEDVDSIGISILSGAHMTLVPRVIDTLRARDAGEVAVIVGGTIPAADIQELQRLGVSGVFTPGAGTTAITEFIQDMQVRT